MMSRNAATAHNCRDAKMYFHWNHRKRANSSTNHSGHSSSLDWKYPESRNFFCDTGLAIGGLKSEG
jgi:hypothetical protein